MNDETDRTASGAAESPGRGTGEFRNAAANVEGTAVQIGTVSGDVYVGGHARQDEGVPLIVTVQQPFSYFVAPLEDALPAERTSPIPEPKPVTRQECLGLVDRADVAHGQGWSDALTVLVEGRGPQAVILAALRPAVLARRPARPMTTVSSTRQVLEPRRFVLDLDGVPARLHAAQGPGFPFTVTASDPEQFRITLELHDPVDVDWVMELDWICAGRTGTIRLPDTGHYTHFPLPE